MYSFDNCNAPLTVGVGVTVGVGEMVGVGDGAGVGLTVGVGVAVPDVEVIIAAKPVLSLLYVLLLP